MKPNHRLSATARLWSRLRSHSVELRLSLRVTVAALLAFGLSELFRLPLVMWPVLTSVIVTQLSVGKSLKTTFDYFAGTLGGAIYAGAIATLIPHASEAALLAVLALAVAPLAFLAALNPSFSVAPATGVIVVLAPLITHGGPVESAVYRVMEVALGGGAGLLVSLLVLPARAHGIALEAASRLLEAMAHGLRELLMGFTRQLESASVRAIHERIATAFARLETIAGEAKREQMARLTTEPDLKPLARTLLRLRHDLIMIARAAVIPLPDAFCSRLALPLAAVAEAGASYLRKSAAALAARTAPPPLGALELAIEDYEAEIAALRRERLLRELPLEVVERIFALSFVLEELRRNLTDLNQRVMELRS